MPFVKSCWAEFVVTCNKAFIVKEKIKLLKEKLHGWNKEVFGLFDLNVETMVKELNALHHVLGVTWDEETLLQRKEVHTKFWKDIHLKESLLLQMSKARWVKEGDANSKYFHSIVRYRRRRSTLTLLDENGSMVDDVEGVKSRVKRHLESCFDEPNHIFPTLGGINFNQISSVENAFLMEPFSEEETKAAV